MIRLPILTTSLIHYLENVLFEFGSERVDGTAEAIPWALATTDRLRVELSCASQCAQIGIDWWL